MRLLSMLFTLAAISLASFAIIQLPVRVHTGFDGTFVTQYLSWIGGVLQGSFGWSREYRRPVTDVIGDRLLLTVLVAACALLLTWAVALPAGLYAATHRHEPLAYLISFFGMLGLAVPHVLLALVVLYLGFEYFNTDLGGLFSAELQDAPWGWAKVGDLLRHLPLPAAILAAAPIAHAIRVLRASLLDEMSMPYVATARAKGMPRWRATLKYPLRVAMQPFVSTIGHSTADVVAGTIVVALVFDLPTLGPVLLKALIAQDQFLAGTIVMITGVITVAGSFVSDLLLLWIDPRIRRAR